MNTLYRYRLLSEKLTVTNLFKKMCNGTRNSALAPPTYFSDRIFHNLLHIIFKIVGKFLNILHIC